MTQSLQPRLAELPSQEISSYVQVHKDVVFVNPQSLETDQIKIIDKAPDSVVDFFQMLCVNNIEPSAEIIGKLMFSKTEESLSNLRQVMKSISASPPLCLSAQRPAQALLQLLFVSESSLFNASQKQQQQLINIVRHLIEISGQLAGQFNNESIHDLAERALKCQFNPDLELLVTQEVLKTGGFRRPLEPGFGSKLVLKYISNQQKVIKQCISKAQHSVNDKQILLDFLGLKQVNLVNEMIIEFTKTKDEALGIKIRQMFSQQSDIANLTALNLINYIKEIKIDFDFLTQAKENVPSQIHDVFRQIIKQLLQNDDKQARLAALQLYKQENKIIDDVYLRISDIDPDVRCLALQIAQDKSKIIQYLCDITSETKFLESLTAIEFLQNIQQITQLLSRRQQYNNYIDMYEMKMDRFKDEQMIIKKLETELKDVIQSLYPCEECTDDLQKINIIPQHLLPETNQISQLPLIFYYCAQYIILNPKEIQLLQNKLKSSTKEVQVAILTTLKFQKMNLLTGLNSQDLLAYFFQLCKSEELNSISFFDDKYLFSPDNLLEIMNLALDVFDKCSTNEKDIVQQSSITELETNGSRIFGQLLLQSNDSKKFQQYTKKFSPSKEFSICHFQAVCSRYAEIAQMGDLVTDVLDKFIQSSAQQLQIACQILWNLSKREKSPQSFNVFARVICERLRSLKQCEADEELMQQKAVLLDQILEIQQTEYQYAAPNELLVLLLQALTSKGKFYNEVYNKFCQLQDKIKLHYKMVPLFCILKQLKHKEAERYRQYHQSQNELLHTKDPTNPKKQNEYQLYYLSFFCAKLMESGVDVNFKQIVVDFIKSIGGQTDLLKKIAARIRTKQLTQTTAIQVRINAEIDFGQVAPADVYPADLFL